LFSVSGVNMLAQETIIEGANVHYTHSLHSPKAIIVFKETITCDYNYVSIHIYCTLSYRIHIFAGFFKQCQLIYTVSGGRRGGGKVVQSADFGGKYCDCSWWSWLFARPGFELTHIHTNTHNTQTHKHTHAHTVMQTCMHTHTYTITIEHMHSDVDERTRTHAYSPTQTNTYTQTHKFSHSRR